MEPIFDSVALFDLSAKDLSLISLQYNKPIQAVVIRTEASSLQRTVVGTALIEWRKALRGPSSSSGEADSIIAEVKEVNNQHLSVGVLELSLDIVPKPIASTLINGPLFYIPTAEIEFQVRNHSVILHLHFKSDINQSCLQIQSDKKRLDEANRLFFIYAKQWWNDFLQVRSTHSERLVKIFATDEFGRKEPVTNFLHPIQSKPLLFLYLQGGYDLYAVLIYLFHVKKVDGLKVRGMQQDSCHLSATNVYSQLERRAQ